MCSSWNAVEARTVSCGPVKTARRSRRSFASRCTVPAQREAAPARPLASISAAAVAATKSACSRSCSTPRRVVVANWWMLAAITISAPPPRMIPGTV